MGKEKEGGRGEKGREEGRACQDWTLRLVEQSVRQPQAENSTCSEPRNKLRSGPRKKPPSEQHRKLANQEKKKDRSSVTA
eukprot:3486733-Rhodomonas_salina.1